MKHSITTQYTPTHTYSQANPYWVVLVWYTCGTRDMLACYTGATENAGVENAI